MVSNGRKLQGKTSLDMFVVIDIKIVFVVSKSSLGQVKGEIYIFFIIMNNDTFFSMLNNDILFAFEELERNK